MKFKTQAEQDEFRELELKNNKLFKLVLLLEDYVSLNFGKELTLTEVFRTQAEFDALYAATPAEKRPARSPHQDWNAVDIRSFTFEPIQLDKIKTFLNTFKYKDGAKPVCIIHAITGGAMHVHIQFC